MTQHHLQYAGCLALASLFIQDGKHRGTWIMPIPIMKPSCLYEKNVPVFFVWENTSTTFDLVFYLCASEVEKCLHKKLYPLGLSD